MTRSCHVRNHRWLVSALCILLIPCLVLNDVMSMRIWQKYILHVHSLSQGSPTLFLESYHPVGFHSNPNLAHLILVISSLINWTRLVTTGVGAIAYKKVQKLSRNRVGHLWYRVGLHWFTVSIAYNMQLNPGHEIDLKSHIIKLNSRNLLWRKVLARCG